ncbi:hypothetical protein PHYBLDRAFT_146417 [Phycomyces blakesleeanus NRRL 1555(-)]|uniref:Uncharacterized protein n=1 Tax=Phycomyces blakesleeanus (strain ATCC 8743b / DSM 1359 / FGSC 10004 / NBRC 33097 / NRRL 1555) TaxID=763407 RepID=A0A162X811_PHYB8|nr:hypothetical protein PHYBLDRAFT_146417 [Phycomyces blakesleeanus NRRL 1555(-)]OAD73105.1 hypothetical protein PHYBLDRAFT_146417 [Phycomyces blakesleeanus NRRL 1555(-)]|eukprot:XP_018291145.1 hypothetical protein PHYBLDRAFT_146417 [Phycomyces blakesleeanus NRRL 1555(-)]
MNAVLNSTIVEVVSLIFILTPEVAVVAAPDVQVAVTPIDHVLTLLAANNNGLDLSNKTNKYLKNSVLQLMTSNTKIKKATTSQNFMLPSAVPADSSSSIDDDVVFQCWCYNYDIKS